MTNFRRCEFNLRSNTHEEVVPKPFSSLAHSIRRELFRRREFFRRREQGLRDNTNMQVEAPLSSHVRLASRELNLRGAIIKTVNNRRGGKDMTRVLNVTLMMLILAFFIVLNALSVPSETLRKKALGSFTGTLGILPGGLSPFSSEGSNLSGQGAPVSSEKIELAALIGKFEEYMIKTNAHLFARSFISKGGLKLVLDNKIIFKPGSADFSNQGLTTIEKLAPIFRQAKGKLIVESHTNSEKIVSARFPDAMVLSAARAGAIVRYMISSTGLKREKLSIAGYGALKPLKEELKFRDQVENDRTVLRYKWTI